MFHFLPEDATHVDSEAGVFYKKDDTQLSFFCDQNNSWVPITDDMTLAAINSRFPHFLHIINNQFLPGKLSKVIREIFISETETEDSPQFQDGSGKDNNYYLAKVTHSKRLGEYTAECEDIIRALDMTFDEGEAFKAIWRNAALRLGGGKPGDSELRNGEKVEHYGKGMQLYARQRMNQE